MNTTTSGVGSGSDSNKHQRAESFSTFLCEKIVVKVGNAAARDRVGGSGGAWGTAADS